MKYFRGKAFRGRPFFWPRIRSILSHHFLNSSTQLKATSMSSPYHQARIRTTKMNTNNNNNLSAFPAAAVSGSAVSNTNASCAFSSPATAISTSCISTLAAPAAAKKKDDNNYRADSTHSAVTPSPSTFSEDIDSSMVSGSDDNRGVENTSSPPELNLLASLATTILDESTGASSAKNKRKHHQGDEEDEAEDTDAAKNNNEDGNEPLRSIRMPAVSAEAEFAPSHVHRPRLTSGTTGTNNVATNKNGDEKEGGSNATLVSSATTANKKVRPTSLWTEDSADSGVNEMHCFMLKELLEVVYEPKPLEWGGRGATTKKKKAGNNGGNDDDDDNTSRTTSKRRRNLSQAREITATATDNTYAETTGGGADDDEDYKDGNDEAYDRPSPPSSFVPAFAASAKNEKKKNHRLVPKTIMADGKTAILCTDASITNQVCIRCRYCKLTTGTGITRPASLEEGHLYVKTIRRENLHYLNKCPNAPKEKLAKLQALKKKRARGLKRAWKNNALKQGFVAVVNEAGEPLGIAFKE